MAITLPEQTVVIETGMETPKRVGLIIFFLVFGVFGLWSAVAPIDEAALAPGIVTVESYKKAVQHLEGGIISEIFVRNGDNVAAGQPLVTIDSTQALAQLEILNGQFSALKAAEARLLAERDGRSEISFPVELATGSNSAQAEISSQEQIFNTRRNSRQGNIEVLEQRIGQLQSRSEGLTALKGSKEELAASFREELDDVSELLSQGFADKNRLRELERSHAVHSGEAAELAASISSTDIQIGETRLEILQQERQFQTEVANHLAEVQTNLVDVSERRAALQDIVDRTVIRAPVEGIVNGMQFHTIGGVVPPGTIIAEIVPQTDELIVEAQISPVDIDRVAVGQDATIRFSAFGSSVPITFGKLIAISADSFSDQRTGASYYIARVEVTPEGLADLGNLVLLPGMPAEVFIATGSRTFIQYLFKPFSNAIARSFNES